MAVTSYKSSGAQANADRDSEQAWGDVTNASGSDDAWATVTPASNHYSDWLRLTNFGFTAADIPAGATINGIEMTVERKTISEPPTNSNKDSAFYLRKTSGQTGDNKADTSTVWTTTEQTITYGGAADMWGTSLTQEDIVSEDFGVDLSVYALGNTGRIMYIDDVQIRVYYTEASETTKHFRTLMGVGV